MKVVYTDEALRDLDEILTYIAANYPTAFAPFEKRLHTAVTRIGAWPESAAEVAQRPGVRVVPLVRYPYKIFYRVTNDAVEILYIHHAARQESWEGSR
jgi:plasmid stabilization system protein ParE